MNRTRGPFEWRDWKDFSCTLLGKQKSGTTRSSRTRSWNTNGSPTIFDLENKTIVDGGSHHGHYSLFFAMAAKKTGRLISVDPFPMNNTLTRVNLTLNGFEPEIVRCALSDQNGQVRFSNESNGRIVHGKSGVMVEAKRLDAVCDTADVIKLDVEGAEYSILPVALERCPSVSTWIVEVHPMNMPHPDGLVRLFEKHGYDVFYVNRDLNKVEQYRLGTEWRIHSTLFAVR